RRVTPEWRSRLLDAGIPEGVIAWGAVGILPCLPNGDYFEPRRSGKDLVIVPVKMALDQTSPEYDDPANVLQHGAVVDLLAFDLDEPLEWMQRTGAAQWLGAIGPQMMSPDPVNIRRSPLSWLRRGGDGIVPLSADEYEQHLVLVTIRYPVGEDELHAAELAKALDWRPARPDVF